jgi:hypothetical protein
VAGGGVGASGRGSARRAKWGHDLHGQAIRKARILASIHPTSGKGYSAQLDSRFTGFKKFVRASDGYV